jgi:hypothetical protein
MVAGERGIALVLGTAISSAIFLFDPAASSACSACSICSCASGMVTPSG